MSDSRPTYLILALFVVAATLFSGVRVPFDDEWFSLTLVSEASSEGFWRSLGRDMHPPWLAMLDRAIWSLWPDRLPLIFLRVLACGLAAALWLSLLRPLNAPRPWVFAFALLHPIVFFYAGAQRWYPILMLAHALRHWAILSEAPVRRRQMALCFGSGLGVASGYVDLLFVAHDFVHYGWRERKTWRQALAAVIGALVCVALVIGASPILDAHWAIFSHQAGKAWPLVNTLFWAGLGPLGEALPHVWWLALAPLVVVAAVRGARALVEAGIRPQAVWLTLSLALSWLVATRFGVWSPRYSLELWWLMMVAILAPIALSHSRSLWSWAASALVLVGLLSTLSGQLFFKADLNAPPEGFCEELEGESAPDVYVIPYHRVSEQFKAMCAPTPEIIDPPEMRHVANAEELLGGLSARVAQGGAFRLVAITSQAGIKRTRARVRALLEAQCKRGDERALWPPSHPWIRRHLIEGPDHRIITTDFRCRPSALKRGD